jgi:hypothetical protein
MKQKRKSHRALLLELPVGPKADELDREIIKAIQEGCQQDLTELKRAGISPMMVTFAAIQIVKKHWEVMPEDLKERFRERADAWKQMATHSEKMSHKSRSFSTPEIKSLQARAESMRNGSRQIGRLLRRFRKDHNQGIALLLYALQAYKKDFDSWDALKQVLATAFNEAGIESKHITADNLRKIAKRNRILHTGEQLTWEQR